MFRGSAAVSRGLYLCLFIPTFYLHWFSGGFSYLTDIMIGLYSAFLFAAQLGLGTSAPLESRQSGAATTSPPYYPAPKGGYAASWADAYNKAYDLVSQMTLLEKGLYFLSPLSSN